MNVAITAESRELMYFLELCIMFPHRIICFRVHRLLSRLNLYGSCGMIARVEIGKGEQHIIRNTSLAGEKLCRWNNQASSILTQLALAFLLF